MNRINRQVIEAGGQCGDCNTCERKCNELQQQEQSHEGLTFYTMIIYSENFAGVLNQITAVFTRRQINIESINACASSIQGVHRYTVTCWCTEDVAQLLVKQIEKKIDVIKADFYPDDEIFSIETCLIKISTPLSIDNAEVRNVVRHYRANVVEMNSTYCIVERKGRSSSINGLYESLNALGVVLQFVRSGRIAVTRSHIEHLDLYLSERENEINR